MRTWSLRLNAVYEGDQSQVAVLSIGLKDEHGQYQPLEIGNGSAGFLIFVYSLLSCQHHYMVANATEHGLVLAESSGDLELIAGDDWMLTSLHVAFEAKLRSGTPSAQDVEAIRGRMNQCPVSRNIHPTQAHETTLTFVA